MTPNRSKEEQNTQLAKASQRLLRAPEGSGGWRPGPLQKASHRNAEARAQLPQLREPARTAPKLMFKPEKEKRKREWKNRFSSLF